MTVAYVLISAAALLRVFEPWLAENRYTIVLAASSAAWVAAFLIFLVVYIPILLLPRADGRPG